MTPTRELAVQVYEVCTTLVDAVQEAGAGVRMYVCCLAAQSIN